MNLDKAIIAEMLRRIIDQTFDNIEKHGEFSSNHEIYGVLLEEVDEFWDQVKEHHNNEPFDCKELIDIAAVCIHAAIQMRQSQEVKK